MPYHLLFEWKIRSNPLHKFWATGSAAVTRLADEISVVQNPCRTIELLGLLISNRSHRLFLFYISRSVLPPLEHCLPIQLTHMPMRTHTHTHTHTQRLIEPTTLSLSLFLFLSQPFLGHALTHRKFLQSLMIGSFDASGNFSVDIETKIFWPRSKMFLIFFHF